MNRNRIQLAAICAFVFVLVFATVAAAHGAKVDGQWKLTLQSPNGPEIRTLVFTSAGGKLTGAMKAGSDDIAITGTIDGNKITFKISPHGDGPFTFTGTVNGDSMKGTASIRGSDRDWTATRSKSQ
jgi:hypothetical protein